MKKKLLSLLLAGVMTISVFAGCGQETQNDAPAGTESSEENVVTEDETLTVWCWDPAYNINALKVAERIYQEEHPNFKLEVIETNQEEIYTKLATSTTSGNFEVLPDIFLFDDTNFQMAATAYASAFMDLTDYGFNYESFSPGKVGFSVVNGRNIGIPFDSGTAIACYRTDILAQAGYTIEDFTDITWSEFIEKAKVVLEKTGCPLLNGLSSYNQLTIMLQSAGGAFFDEEGNPYIVGNEILEKTVETYVEMVEAGVYVEETGWDTYIGGMNTGRVAGAMNGCWIMSSIKAAEDQSGLWEITNLPKLDGIETATNYSSQGGSSWALSSNCKNPELAIDFFKETFGGSTELYDEILPTGAISTWLPAAASARYAEPMEFFNNQPVFSMITTYSGNVPECVTGVYFQSARNCVVNAITNILYSGYSVEDALAAAEETLTFEMEQ